jgi:FKBP-type peptidyl-prolyl cis-trans isomerase
MGIEGMKIGEKRRLLIPYTLAYGEAGRPPVIPAKSDLVFDVELMDITPDAIPKPFNVEGLDTVTTESGLKYIITKKTDGPVAADGDTVVVKYVAYFLDGKILESSYERDDSLMIVGGSKAMIPGMVEAVSILKKGEKARVIIPYQLGFGEAGHPPVIPAKSTLIFDVYIQSVYKSKKETPIKE